MEKRNGEAIVGCQLITYSKMTVAWLLCCCRVHIANCYYYYYSKCKRCRIMQL